MSFANKTDDELVTAAATGDRVAAGEYFARNLGFLAAMARRVSDGMIDADDLLADAIAALLAKWAEGRGPRDHVNTYVIRSMRNRLIDEVRSPRSRVLTTDWDVEPMSEDHERYRAADLHREFRYVQDAMQRLPEDQRSVLTATVIDGRKPGDLEAELGRPAGAIYSLVRRSRISLRRAMLRVMLEEDAPSRCRRHAGQLPELVPDDPDDAGPSKGMAHIRECPRCRAVWARFGAVSTTLGVSTLLAVGSALGGPAVSAEAAEQEKPRVRGRRALLVAGVAASAAGAVLVGSWVFTTVGGTTPTASPEPSPSGSFTVDVAVQSPTTATMTIWFGVAESDWQMEELTIELPPTVTFAGGPQGWDCTPGASGVRCQTSTTNPTGGVFVFETAEGWGSSEYEVIIRADAGGTAFTGHASGMFDPTGEAGDP